MTSTDAICVITTTLAAALDERSPDAIEQLRAVVQYSPTRAAWLFDELQRLSAIADAAAAGHPLAAADAALFATERAQRILFRLDGNRRTRGGAFLLFARMHRRWSHRTIARGLVDALAVAVRR